MSIQKQIAIKLIVKFEYLYMHQAHKEIKLKRKEYNKKKITSLIVLLNKITKDPQESASAD